MKSVLVIAALCCAFISSARADALDDVKARGKLVCGTLTNLVPLGFEDPKTRQVVGFDIDLCNALAKALGVGLEHRRLSLDSRIPELQLGRVDVVAAALGYSKARAEQIDFTDSHYQIGMGLLSKAENGLTRLAQFDGKRISSIKGSSTEAMARKAVPTATIITFPDAPSAYMAMLQDKVVATTMNEMTGVRYRSESKVPLVMSEIMVYEPTALGVKKGETALLNAVNTALRKLEAEGELDRIWDRWIGKNNPLGPDFAVPRTKKLTPISQVDG